MKDMIIYNKVDLMYQLLIQVLIGFDFIFACFIYVIVCFRERVCGEGGRVIDGLGLWEGGDSGVGRGWNFN